MTNTEIIKELGLRIDDFSKSVLDLINRQKAEIEKLQDENWLLKEQLDNAERLNYDMRDEIEKLNIELQSMRSATNSYKIHYEAAASEAIREFAKELKNCFAISGDYLYIINIIDNLVKEMAEVETNQRKEDEKNG